MARKRRTSPIEDLIEFGSLLPYWASLLIAVIAYLFFHSYASSDVQLSTQPGSSLPQNFGGVIFRTLSSFLQYLVPLAFVIGAILSGIKSLKARTQAKRYEQWSDSGSSNASQKQSPDKTKPTDQMNWSQFELLVGEAFKKQGYRVIHGGDAGADGGIDVHLRKDGKTYLVQCKHWKTKRVGVAVIRELYGVMVSSGVSGGYVVTSGDFTDEAQSFAEGKPLKLIDGNGLARMLGRESAASAEEISDAEPTSSVIHCPKCSSPMVKRVAKRGTNVGNEFMGCTRYPQCKKTIAL